MFMRNLLLVLTLVTVATMAKAHEVASVETPADDTVKYWILDEVN
tara:strand:- start:21973 stop:22107 length:135 start_codon:yes stop_codon:yes gene_type:complete